MLKDNRIIAVFMRLVSVAFVVILAALTGLSLVYHCKVDIYAYDLPRTIERHSPILYGGLAISGIIILVIFRKLLDKVLLKIGNDWLIARIVTIFCIGIVSVGSLLWICFNDALPKSDQAIIYKEAGKIAGFVKGEFDTSYFGWFPRNRGMALLVAGLFRLFGETQNAFQILNIGGAALLIMSVYLATKRGWNNARITIIAVLIITLYYPIIIYTSYIYGTLLSASLSSCCFAVALRFCDEYEWKSIMMTAILFPLAIQMHQSAAIALIAVIIYILLHITKKVWKKTFLFIAAPLLGVLLLNITVDFAYERITSSEPIDSVPSITWFYMGLTSENELGGPGSQDGSMYQIFLENGYDSEATVKDTVKRISKVLVEYLRGERKFSFFIEKTKHQWLDPTFTARRVIRLNEVENGEIPNSEAYTNFYYSSLRDIGFKILIIYLILIYTLNIITGIHGINQDSGMGLLLLIQLFFMGGFVFQLGWESIGRYCFSYFIWLIPQAAYGVEQLYSVLSKEMNWGVGRRCRKSINE